MLNNYSVGAKQPNPAVGYSLSNRLLYLIEIRAGEIVRKAPFVNASPRFSDFVAPCPYVIESPCPGRSIAKNRILPDRIALVSCCPDDECQLLIRRAMYRCQPSSRRQ